VTKPVLYRHFASKQALHRALLEHHRDALAAEALDPYLAEGTLEDRLPAMLDAWFAYLERHPDACRLLLRDAGEEQTRELYRDLHERQRAADAAILRESLPHLTEEQIAPLAAVRAQRALAGLGLWWLEHPEIGREVVVETMLGVLSAILAKAPPNGPRARPERSGWAPARQAARDRCSYRIDAWRASRRYSRWIQPLLRGERRGP